MSNLKAEDIFSLEIHVNGLKMTTLGDSTKITSNIFQSNDGCQYKEVAHYVNSSLNGEWAWWEAFIVYIQYGPITTEQNNSICYDESTETKFKDGNPFGMFTDNMTFRIDCLTFEECKLKKGHKFHNIASEKQLENIMYIPIKRGM